MDNDDLENKKVYELEEIAEKLGCFDTYSINDDIPNDPAVLIKMIRTARKENESED